jgi:hypothetical protein
VEKEKQHLLWCIQMGVVVNQANKELKVNIQDNK